MSSAKQNRAIARLVVGAMSIDGTLDADERTKVATALDSIGMGELIADVGLAIEEDDGTFNLFAECKQLVELLGAHASEVTPLVFRVVADIVAHDRFVSAREAAYLSGMAKKLEIPTEMAKSIFRQVMAERRARLEIAASKVDPEIHPHLKELLSFSGAEALVGRDETTPEESLEQLLESADAETSTLSADDFLRAMTILGLDRTASFHDAESVWKETINNLDLPKMANLGEAFVSAAINRISRVNEAYKTVLKFNHQAQLSKAA